MTSVKSAKRALLYLLLATFVLVLWVFQPMGIALFLATILAVALWPMHNRVSGAFRNRPRIAAALLIVGVVLLLLTPLVFLSIFVIKEATEAVKVVSDTVRTEGIEGLIARLPDRIEKFARQGLARLPESGGGLQATLQEQLSARGTQAAAALGAVLVGTGSLLFQSSMMLIALFFFLTEKERILAFIDDASPLAVGQTRELLSEFRGVSGAVLRSTVLTAAVQTVAALIGYYLTKVPYPIFFGAITFFFALIPAIGAAAVCLLASAILLVSGHPMAAAFLAGWGILVVGLSDNLVKPLLIRRGVELHGAVVFFALLGGLAAFGAIGLVLGPLVVALFVAMLRIYHRDYGGDGGITERAVVRRPEEERGPAWLLVPRDVEG